MSFVLYSQVRPRLESRGAAAGSAASLPGATREPLRSSRCPMKGARRRLSPRSPRPPGAGSPPDPGGSCSGAPAPAAAGEGTTELCGAGFVTGGCFRLEFGPAPRSRRAAAELSVSAFPAAPGRSLRQRPALPRAGGSPEPAGTGEGAERSCPGTAARGERAAAPEAAGLVVVLMLLFLSFFFFFFSFSLPLPQREANKAATFLPPQLSAVVTARLARRSRAGP